MASCICQILSDLTLLFLPELCSHNIFLSKEFLDVSCERKKLNFCIPCVWQAARDTCSDFCIDADKNFQLLPTLMTKQFSLQFKTLFRESHSCAFPSSSDLIILFHLLQFGTYNDSEKKTEEYDTQVGRNHVTSDRESLYEQPAE